MQKTRLQDSTAGRGSNSVKVRRYNERVVLHKLLQCGHASKADLSRKANLTNAAVGVIVDELAADGLIRMKGKNHAGSRGQPAMLYELCENGAFGIGVRLDRSCMETILMNVSGTVIARQVHEFLLPSPAEALAIVTHDISLLMTALPNNPAKRSFANYRIKGIGLAQPFHLGGWLRELDLPSTTFTQWEEFDFRQALETETGFPVFAENDDTAAAMAELFYGVGPGQDSFLYVFIGAAVGGGVVLNGKPIRGNTGNAGDLATIPVPPSKLASAPEPKGEWDILITRASLNSLIRHLAYHGIITDSLSSLEANIATAHEFVDEWIEDCVDALVPAIFSAMAVIDAPLLVFDCDVNAGFRTKLQEQLAQALKVRAPEGRQPPHVRIGSFGSDAGAIGAATLPIFMSFSPQKSILTNSEFASAA